MTKRKAHILVLSDPPVAPGYLPRVRYLCDYLKRGGYEVTYITEDVQPIDFAHDYSIKTVRMYKGGTIEWLVKAAWTLLTDWYNRIFAKRALSVLDGKKYDLVLCSSFNDFPLGAAARIAKRWNVPLVCDIRDLEEQVTDSRYQYRHQAWWAMPFRGLYRTIHRSRRNAVLRQANAITTVSSWHAEFIGTINHQPSAISVVYNGFDEQQFYAKDIRTEQFTIRYIGSLFAWQRPALAKVKQIANSMHIPLEIHTPQQEPIAHDRLGDAIRESSIMLVLTSTETHGMLTTKFYEALGCNKPVLCVPSDQGALAELIAYTNAGIATDDEAAIRAFINEKYAEWQDKGYTHQQSVHREEYTREAQCRKMEEILKHILS